MTSMRRRCCLQGCDQRPPLAKWSQRALTSAFHQAGSHQRPNATSVQLLPQAGKGKGFFEGSFSLQCEGEGQEVGEEVVVQVIALAFEMDALLADALRDFEDEDATTQQNQQAQQQVVADLAPPPCTQFPDPGPAEPLPGNVRGPTLPPRTSKVPSVAAGAATTSTATSSPGLQQRPLGGMPQLPTRSKKPQKTHEQQPVLRPEAQRLADEIMRLMEESGLGAHQLRGFVETGGCHTCRTCT